MAKKRKGRGWIKLYRQIQDNELWQSGEPFSRRDAWIDLLLMANHEQRTIVIRGRPKVINAGEHWTSYRILADRWHWSYEKVRRYFDLLDELDMAHTTVTPSGTLVTLVNYSFFQGGDGAECDTRDSAHDRTDDRTDDRQTRTKEELLRMKKNNAAEPLSDSGGYEIEK